MARNLEMFICLAFFTFIWLTLAQDEFPEPDSWKEMDNDDSEYVDPSDMGTYQHGVQRNARKSLGSSGFKMEEERLRRASYFKNRRNKEVNDLPPAEDKDEEEVLVEIETAEEIHSETKTCIGTVFLRRVIASLLAQMRVRNHNFGPKEAITIDLQAEITHEDLRTLNKFLSSNQESHSTLGKVDSIVSKMFHVVQPGLAIGFYEYFTNEIGFGVVWTMKFWLIVFSSCVVFLISIILLIQMYTTRSLMKIMVYGVAIFFILSCVWVFAEYGEQAKATNAARLHQYQTIPKDCDFDNLGAWDSVGYFMRVKVMGYPDRCEAYHKEMIMDPFYTHSPIIAISETFSKLLFHPVGYIGGQIGDFFAGIVAAVPFWLKPLIILFVFVFGFFGIFRYKISTPFLTIEPVQLPQIEDQRRIENQLMERPPAAIVRAAMRDASTSTEDFEEFLNMGRGNEEFHADDDQGMIFQFWNLVVQVISVSLGQFGQIMNFLLRQVPDEELYPGEDIQGQEIPEIVQEIADDPLPVIVENDQVVIEQQAIPEDPQEIPGIVQEVPNEVIDPANVHSFDEDIWRDLPIPRRNQNNGWVYVDDTVKENESSSSSSSENLTVGDKRMEGENVLRNRREFGGGDCQNLNLDRGHGQRTGPGPSSPLGKSRDLNKTL
jgi:hypothetical protein